MEPGKTININQCVDLYGDLLYRYTLVRVRNAEEAADIVQSTFLAALQSRHDYVGRSTEKKRYSDLEKIIDREVTILCR